MFSVLPTLSLPSVFNHLFYFFSFKKQIVCISVSAKSSYVTFE